MAAVPPDIRQRKYRVICRLGHPVLNSQYELYPGVTLLPFYTFPPSHPRPLSRTSLCPSVPLLSRPPFPWAYLSWRAASSPAGSAFSLQPESFLPRSEFPPSCSNQLKSRPPPQRLEESQQTQKHGPKELCCSCPSGVIRRNVSQSPVCSADFPFPPFTVQSCLPEGVLSSLSTETRCDHFSVLPQLVQRGAQMLGKCSLTDESLFIGHKTWQSVCLQDLVAFLLEGRSWSRSPFCPRPPG